MTGTYKVVSSLKNEYKNTVIKLIGDEIFTGKRSVVLGVDIINRNS